MTWREVLRKSPVPATGSPSGGARRPNLLALYRSSFYLLSVAIMLSAFLLAAELFATPSRAANDVDVVAALGQAAEGAGDLLGALVSGTAAALKPAVHWLIVFFALVYAYAAVKLVERKHYLAAEAPQGHEEHCSPQPAPGHASPADVTALARLEDKLVERIVAHMPLSDLAAALIDADEETIDAVLRNISSSRGERLRQELLLAQGLSSRYLERARARLAEEIRRALSAQAA